MKLLVSVEDFLNLYPELNSFDEEVIEASLKLAESLCPAKVWAPDGDTTKQVQGIMLRAAHSLEVKRLQIAKSAAAGAGVSLGQASIPSAISGNNLDQTHYGVEFKALRKTLPIIGIIAI